MMNLAIANWCFGIWLKFWNVACTMAGGWKEDAPNLDGVGLCFLLVESDTSPNLSPVQGDAFQFFPVFRSRTKHSDVTMFSAPGLRIPMISDIPVPDSASRWFLMFESRTMHPQFGNLTNHNLEFGPTLIFACVGSECCSEKPLSPLFERFGAMLVEFPFSVC
jgi:hypothetical protein